MIALIGLKNAGQGIRAADVRWNSILKLMVLTGIIKSDEYCVYGSLNALKHWRNIKHLHVYTRHLLIILAACFYGMVFNKETIYHLVEKNYLSNSFTFYTKWNDKIRNLVLHKLPIKVIAINEGLANHLLCQDYIVIPPIFERQKFQSDCCKIFDVIYCVSADYYQEINLVSEAVEKLNIKVLYIISKYPQFKDLIYIPKNVTVKENLSYRDLIKNYLSSQYAILPLEDNDKNRFRFPNKFAEYYIHGCRIIASPIGSILNYRDLVYSEISDFSAEGVERAINYALNRNISGDVELIDCFYLDNYADSVKNYLVK